MSHSLEQVMSAKSDEQLNAIFSQRHRYEPEAIVAVVDELQKRNLLTGEMLDEKNKALQAIQQRDRAVSPKPSFSDGLVLLKPSRNYLYTPIILYINVAIWLIMVLLGVDAMNPAIDDLVKWGGNLRGLTLDGELWRLFTSTFLHGGILHLALNMYALISIGAILEPTFGKTRYLLAYVATGIFASIASLAFHDNIVSVGASGAIFGLDGLLLALLVTKTIDIPQEARKSLMSSTLVFIGYNLLFGFAKEGIDNAAHIGGLVSGFLIGLLYWRGKSSFVSIAIVAMVAAAVILANVLIRDAFKAYNAAIKTFAKNEQRALWMFNEETPPPSAIPAYQHRLQEEGIALWKENIAILDSLKNMPEGIQQRIDLLKTYSQLRIRSCEAFSALARDSSDANAQKIKEIESEVSTVLEKLKNLK